MDEVRPYQEPIHLTQKEATDLDVVKGGLVGDIIEQQQCWEQKANENTFSSCDSLPITHNLVYHTLQVEAESMAPTAQPQLPRAGTLCP